MNFGVTAWQWWLQTFVSTTLILTFAAAAISLVRQPARRKRLCELALLGCVAAAALAAVPGVPRWSLGGWLGEERIARLFQAAPQHKTAAAVERFGPVASDVLVPSRPILVDAAASDSGAADADTTHLARIVVAAETDEIAQTQSSVLFDWEFDAQATLLTVYALGLAGMGLWWLCGLAAVWRVVRTARPAPSTVKILLAEIIAQSGPSGQTRKVRLLVSKCSTQPFTFTWLVPTIVLPQSLVEGDSRRLRWSLAHERAHVAAGDARWWSLAGAVRVLLFYQPLVYALRRNLRLCQDYLADSAATGETCAEDYAEFLTLCVAQMSAPARPAALLGIGGGKSELHRRVAMLVEPQVDLERRCPRRWSIGAALAAVCVVLVAAATNLSEQPAQAIEPEEPVPASAKDGLAGEPTSGQPRATQQHIEKGLAWLQRVQAADPAIERAIAHLRSTQRADGTWPDVSGNQGGVTAICTLALLRAGTPVDDPQLQKALTQVRALEPSMTYVVALQTLALCAGQPQVDMALIRRNVAWLEKNQCHQGATQTPAEAFQAWLKNAERQSGMGGWSYNNSKSRADGSNTFFALLALDAARRADAEVKLETWQAALDYWMTQQTADGGWPYTPGAPVTPTMTAAGVASLSIAVRQCAHDDESDETHERRAAAVVRGVAWLNKNWPLASPTHAGNWQFYYLHTFSAAARLSGQAKFGEHSWKKECSEWLLSRQKADGSWTGTATEQNPALATSFAVIFLCAEKNADEKPAIAVPQPGKAGTIAPLDVIRIEVVGTFLGQDIQGEFIVEPEGEVALGPSYGRVNLKGLTYRQAEEAITTRLKKILRAPEVSVTLGGWKRGQPEDPRVRRLENELRSLKSTVEALQREKAEKDKKAESAKP